jgi:hypothetical protein
MDFRPDVMGDETHDPLAIRGGQFFTGVRKAFGQTVDPQVTVGIKHHLDNRWILKPSGDRRPERRAQHPRTARGRFRFQ